MTTGDAGDSKVAPRPLTVGQVTELIARLEAAVILAESMKAIHAVYAAEANAYRQVLATLEAL